MASDSAGVAGAAERAVDATEMADCAVLETTDGARDDTTDEARDDTTLGACVVGDFHGGVFQRLGESACRARVCQEVYLAGCRGYELIVVLGEIAGLGSGEPRLHRGGEWFTLPCRSRGGRVNCSTRQFLTWASYLYPSCTLKSCRLMVLNQSLSGLAESGFAVYPALTLECRL